MDVAFSFFVDRRPSTVDRKRSNVQRLTSNDGLKLKIENGQLKIVVCLRHEFYFWNSPSKLEGVPVRAGACVLPSTDNRQPSTVDRQLSTDNFQLSIFNFQFSIFRAWASALSSPPLYPSGRGGEGPDWYLAPQSFGIVRRPWCAARRSAFLSCTTQ